MSFSPSPTSRLLPPTRFAMSTRSSVPVPRPIKLAQGSSPQPHTILSTLHFTLALLALLIKLPFYLVWHFILFRHHSPLTRVAGRHPLAETIYHIAKCIFNDFPLPASRAVFATQLFLRRDKWIERVTAPEGVDGVWIRPPRAGKEPDDLVLFWIHGGAFNHDIIGSNMLFYKSLARNVNDHSGSPRAFSIFVLDYRKSSVPLYSQLIRGSADNPTNLRSGPRNHLPIAVDRGSSRISLPHSYARDP